MWARATFLSIMIMASPAAAKAKVALKDDPTIEQGLVTVAIGKLLYRGCDDITPRRLKAIGFASSLNKRAKSLGYSGAEIDAYLDSDKDKNRVKAKARKYLASKGADLKDSSSICAVGRAEIQQETMVGRYLRLN